MCGRDLSSADSATYIQSSLTGSTTNYLCNGCARQSSEILCGTRTKTKNKSSTIVLPDGFEVLSPRFIYAELAKSVVSQNEFLIDISTFGYSHLSRLEKLSNSDEDVPQNMPMLAMGRTGSGKTFAIELLSKIISIDVVPVSCVSLTSQGYVGLDLEDYIKNMLIKHDGDKSMVEISILHLDEFDKNRRTKSNGLDINGEKVQHSLLKYLEGAESITIPIGSKYGKGDVVEVSSKSMGYILSGAFSNIENFFRYKTYKQIGFRTKNGNSEYDESDTTIKEALIKYGIIPEICSRIGTVSMLNELDVGAYISILRNKNGFLERTKKHFLNHEGISLTFEQPVLETLARRAYESKLGARQLSTEIIKLTRMLQFLYFGQEDKPSRVTFYLDRNGEVKYKMKDAPDLNMNEIFGWCSNG